MKKIIALLLLAAMSASAQESGANSVFGFTIGSPITLPECKKQMIGKSVFYLGFTNSICFGASSPTTAASTISHGIYSIYFPAQEQPKLASGLSIVVIVLDGVLEGVSFNTAGISTQSHTLDALKAKYGTPAAFENVQVKNRLGATFDTFVAYWSQPGLLVDFNPVAGALDSGLVHVQTPKSKEYSDRRMNAVLKDARPL